MKTIGLLGGMSWPSTVSYYQQINQAVNARLGGLHSARIAMYSVDFAELERPALDGSWEVTAGILSRAARSLERAGADFLVLCTNTMHRVAPDIETAVDIPLLHIADATADGIRRAGLGKVGMLGTRFTMEHDFYRGRLRERHGVETLVPGEADREQIDRVIFDELVVGEVRPESRDVLLRSIRELVASGSEGIILGCTELGLLVGANDVAVPLFDTTELHARAAVARALDRGSVEDRPPGSS